MRMEAIDTLIERADQAYECWRAVLDCQEVRHAPEKEWRWYQRRADAAYYVSCYGRLDAALYADPLTETR